MNGVLFQNENLAVRARMEPGGRNCVVTFDSYTDQRTLERPGFGEKFFYDLGVDAIHVISRQNDWYQYPEMLEVGALVRDLLASRERVVSYGSSMGGYAAIRFGRLFGADLAAAFSPQFSIDPAVTDFETRWIEDALRIDFCLEREPVPFVRRAFIFYDPRDADRLHVDLYRAHTEVVDVAVPIGGHPCTTILSETGSLRQIVTQILQTGKPPDFLEHFRTARRSSPQFFFNLSMIAKRPRSRAWLAERMYRLRADPMYASHYGLMLAFDGRFDEARPLFRRSLEEEPENLVILYRYSEFLEAEGDLMGSIEVMDRISDLGSDARAFRPRRERLTQRMRERWKSLFNASFAKAAETPPDESLAVATPPEKPQFFRGLLPPWLGGPKPLKPEPPPPGVGVGDYLAPPGVEADVLITTMPTPPQFANSWRRHLKLVSGLPQSPVDLLLFGDSLAEWWPERLFEGLKVFNFSVAGDCSQHLLWRLLQLPDGSLNARRALLMIGTNNLGSGDSAEAIVAGVARVARALGKKVNAERIVILEIPPMGADFGFRAPERRRVNEALRALGFRTLNVDDVLTGGAPGPSVNFAEDGVHFSDAGYAVLTEVLNSAVLAADAVPPEPTQAED